MSNQTSNNIIVRKPLLAYFIFTYAFMWLYFAILFGLFRLDMRSLSDWLSALLTLIASWMPSLAAVIVTGVCEGLGGVHRLFAMFFHFRLPVRWYLAALLPAALTFAAVGMYRLFGGAASGGIPLSLGMWAFVFVNGLLGAATGEEPGWRGFALPRLLQKYSPLKASLILSVIWSFWHLPFLLGRGLVGLDLLTYILVYILFYNFSLTALMTWIFQRTSHSLVPMVLAHFTANFTPVVASALGLGQEMPIFYVIAGLSFVTILIIWSAGGLSRKATSVKLQPGHLNLPF